MRLTPNEIAAAKCATVFDPQIYFNDFGCCPGMMVALARGVPSPSLYRSKPEHIITVQESVSDVAQWLGFSNVGEFLHTMRHEGKDILKRATY